MDRETVIANIAQMLWVRGIGSKQGGRIVAEDIYGWLKKEGLLKEPVKWPVTRRPRASRC